MTLFDLLFLAVLFTSLATLITAAVAAVRGQGGGALRILRRLAVCAAVYMAIVAVAGLAAPQRVLQVGEPWCFDDWCLSVEGMTRTPAGSQVACRVALRIFSRARRVSQRAKGAWVYVIDSRGRRYAPEPDPAAVPLDVLLQPGESVRASRVFMVPTDAGELGLSTGHGRGPGLFIIGDAGSLFHKPTIVRLGN